MSKITKNLLTTTQLKDLRTDGAGYDVLRYISLPELLGKESDTLLYFMGKNLARKFEIDSLESLYLIIEALGWGKLDLVKEKKKELVFELMADSIVLKLQTPFAREFRLESGFIAEAIQQIFGRECECIENINNRINLIKFTIVFTE
ncbi:DUF2507 domain-containing protein [Oceanobacillus salinisoli]|uniref:DUF2507 domain-containing protein n=1 Tax=Oceanobacillus salinisoli TaxID=2678611 RepID=UPI0012E22F19|nr:DUF2507 domain-containing protein [Oceanobacillus salinisoli]